MIQRRRRQHPQPTSLRIVAAAWLAALSLAAIAHPAAAQTITVKPGEDLAAAVAGAKDGATISLAAGRHNGPIVVKGKTLRIRGAGADKTVLVAEKGGVILGASQGVAMVFDLGFEIANAQQVAIGAIGGEVQITRCAVAQIPGRAFVAQDKGVLSIDQCRFGEAKQAAVFATDGSTAGVQNSSVAGGEAGVIVQRGGILSVDASVIRAKQPVVANSGAISVRIVGNRLIATHAEPPIYVRSDGDIEVGKNRILGGDVGMVVKTTAKGTIAVAENSFLGANKGGLYLEFEGAPGATARASLQRNLIALSAASAKGYGLLLTGDGHAALRGNVIVPAKGGPGVHMQSKASAALTENAVLGDGPAATVNAPGARPIRIERGLHLSAADLGIAIGLDETTKALSRSAMEAKAKTRLEQAVAGLHGLAADADDGARAQAEKLLRDSVAAQMAGLANLARIGLRVIDAAGIARPAAFTVLEQSGAELGRYAAGAEAIVPPGDYVMSPEFDPTAEQEFKLAPGRSAIVEIKAEAHRWLKARNRGKEEPVDVLAALRSEAERGAAFDAMQFPEFRRHVAMPRLSATAEERRRAVAIAREWIDQNLGAFPEPYDRAVWDRKWIGNELAARILAAFGEASDAERLLRRAQESKNFNVFNVMVTAAGYLERRLGRLGEGEIARLAKGGAPAEALASRLVLYLMGEGSQRAAIIAALMNKDAPAEIRSQIYAASTVMMADRDPAVTAYMRWIFAQFAAREAELQRLSQAERDKQPNYFFGARYSAAIHILVHGMPADGKLIADLDLGAYQIAPLVSVIRNPVPLIAAMLRSTQVRDASDMCGALRAHGDKDLDAIMTDLTDAALTERLSREHTDARQITNVLPVWFRYYAADCRPSRDMAEWHWKGNAAALDEASPATFQPWNEQKVIKAVTTGTFNRRQFQQLDFLPNERIVAAFAEADRAKAGKVPELIAAYHRVLSQAHFTNAELGNYAYYAGSGAARAFTVVHRLAKEQKKFEYGGALTGIVRLTGRREGDQLVIELAAEAASWLDDYCSLAARIATNNCDIKSWSVGLARERPANYIGRVRVVGAGREEVLEPQSKDDARKRVYTIKPGPGGLAGLYLEVEMGVEEARVQLVYDLFDQPFIRAPRG